jgi:formate dehydrogenase alpha subunit
LEEINLVINNRRISCPPGTSLLDAAHKNGIKIPTLCHDTHLKPVGACRICLVEDEKSGRIMAACTTPVSPQFTIRTDSPIIREHRTNIIRMMMANHPESCIVCNQGNRCELRQVAADLGVGKIDLYPMPHYTGLEDANPFIIRDLSKCILCGKCVRADHELVVVGAIDYHLRGFKSRPRTVHEMPLEKSNCTFCGTCVSICPTGALVTKNTRYVGTPQKESSTICGFCGVGCSLLMGSVGDQIIDVNPSHREGTVNQSTLCVRGHFAHDFLNVSERLTSPLIRKEGELVTTTWDAALGFVIDRLKALKKESGPQSLAFLGSSKCTLEENYLFQKLARSVFGTNNIDNISYGSGRPVLGLIDDRLHGGGRITPLSDLEKAEAIFVIGANPVHSVPVAGYFIKRASRQKHIPLMVADPIKTDLVPFSSIWLPVAPQRDCELINGLAAILFYRQAYDMAFIDRFTLGFDQYADQLSNIDLDDVSRSTGVERDVMEKAADLFERKKTAFVVGHGIFQQRHGDRAMEALLNLAMMTGSLGGEEKGFYLLTRENNQMGAWDMGVAPDTLPGRQRLQNDRVRIQWEDHWGTKLSPDPGLDVVRIIEEAEKGNIKALYIMGENPIRSLPQPERLGKALGQVSLLVVQDILATETSHLADVVLPGAAFSEKGGAFTNMEGRIQSFEPVVSPPGEARPDWEILSRLFDDMGHPKKYTSLKDIRAEISSLVPMYEDLGRQGREGWIKEASDLSVFRADREAEPIRFSSVSPVDDDMPDSVYPFKAILGSRRIHLGSGTRTSHSARIKDFDLKGEVEISPEDGDRLGVKEGEKVRISSAYGSIWRGVTLNKGIRAGHLFIPMAFHDNDARQLIALTQLGEADSPGWKGCQVSIEKSD